MASWDKLVELVTYFDALLSNVRSDVHVVRGEDDWLPPSPTASLKEKYEYLEKVAGHVRDTLEKAQTLSEQGRRKAYESARDTIKEARKLLEALKKIPGPVATGQAMIDVAKASVATAEKSINELWDDLTGAGKWALGAEASAMGVVWIGLAAFVYFFVVKPATQQRA